MRTLLFGDTPQEKTNPGWKIQNPTFTGNCEHCQVNEATSVQHRREPDDEGKLLAFTSPLYLNQALDTFGCPCWSVEKLAPAFLKLQITTKQVAIAGNIEIPCGKQPFASL